MIGEIILAGVLLYLAFKLGQADVLSRIDQVLDERESRSRLGPDGDSRSSSIYDREADAGQPEGLYLLLRRKAEETH